MREPMVLVATRVNRAPDGQQATVWSVLGVCPGGDFTVKEAGSWEDCGTNAAARRIIERLAYGHGGSVTWGDGRSADEVLADESEGGGR